MLYVGITHEFNVERSYLIDRNGSASLIERDRAMSPTIVCAALRDAAARRASDTSMVIDRLQPLKSGLIDQSKLRSITETSEARSIVGKSTSTCTLVYEQIGGVHWDRSSWAEYLRLMLALIKPL